MPSAAPSPIPSKSYKFSSQQASNRYRDAISQGVRIRVHQLIQAGILRPARPNKQCSGNWKPRMDLVDDPSSSNIMAIFELPGVKNENITLQIKDRRLVVVGSRVDPFTEALAAAKAHSEQTSATTNPSRNITNVTSQTTTGSARTGSGGPITASPSTPAMNKSIRELRYGSFFRTIPVPEGIKQSEVTAGIQDGMLTVTWPRVPAAARPSASETAPLSTSSITPMDTVDPTEATPMLQ
ncbi:hypothetical protein D9756_008726 [Leucocoprinus leucothites]|uniref:SHSP domain-containing protein n=1 Tax=Leucocoprinus leucothites TaxID=201217 RepID=A0A8H5FVT0_9AGAR|nr:hypothetical protein D9756_008726 [Leucoagaricus leucothites]